MWMMVLAFFVASIGLFVELQSNLGAQFEFNRHPEYLIFGGILQLAAILVFLMGVKDYFFKEIITELKKLNGEKPAEEGKVPETKA